MTSRRDFSQVRLVVFDLDETLWTLSRDFCAAMAPPYRLEGDRLTDADGRILTLGLDVRSVLTELRSRGYTLSAASRNHPVVGRRVLEILGLWGYFIHPVLQWQDKDLSLLQVLDDFRRLGPRTFSPEETLFIDDWPMNIAHAARVGVAGLVYGVNLVNLSELLDFLPPIGQSPPRFG